MREYPFYSRYPFIADLGKYMEHLYGTELSLKDLLELPGAKELGLRRVLSDLRGSGARPLRDEGREVLSFHIALLLALASDPWALRRFADQEAKRFTSLALSDKDDVVMILASRLGVSIEYVGSEADACGHRVVVGRDSRGLTVVECYPFRVTVPTYLKLASPLLSEPRWKLVNRLVLKGYVYLSKHDVVRLLENAVKDYIIRKAERLASSINEDLLKLIEDEVSRVREVVRSVRGFLSSEEREVAERLKGEVREDAFPPCIKQIMDSLLRGEHLSHHQRFAIATFLLNIGASTDYVLDLMKHLPDYNERIARYQVEHLAGIRGSRKKYNVYSCDKMKTLGMCVAECGVKSPLQYYWRVLKSRVNRKQASRNQGLPHPS